MEGEGRRRKEEDEILIKLNADLPWRSSIVDPRRG